MPLDQDDFISLSHMLEDSNTLLPSQWVRANPVNLTYEQRVAQHLLWITLEDLRRTFVPYTTAELNRGIAVINKREYKKKDLDFSSFTWKKPFLRREILDWFYPSSEKITDGYSFDTVCAELRIEDPSVIIFGIERLCHVWSHTQGRYPFLSLDVLQKKTMGLTKKKLVLVELELN
jgi:hypothetical protein